MKRVTIIAVCLLLMTFIPGRALAEDAVMPANAPKYFTIELQSLIQEANAAEQVVSCQIVDVQFPEESKSTNDSSAELLDEDIMMIKDVFITSIAKGETPPQNILWTDRIDLVADYTIPHLEKYELNEMLIVNSSSLPLLRGPAENEMSNCAEYRARFFSKSGVIIESGNQYQFSEPFMCIIYALHRNVTIDE